MTANRKEREERGTGRGSGRGWHLLMCERQAQEKAGKKVVTLSQTWSWLSREQTPCEGDCVFLFCLVTAAVAAAAAARKVLSCTQTVVAVSSHPGLFYHCGWTPANWWKDDRKSLSSRITGCQHSLLTGTSEEERAGMVSGCWKTCRISGGWRLNLLPQVELRRRKTLETSGGRASMARRL